MVWRAVGRGKRIRETLMVVYFKKEQAAGGEDLVSAGGCKMRVRERREE